MVKLKVILLRYKIRLLSNSALAIAKAWAESTIFLTYPATHPEKYVKVIIQHKPQ